VERQSIPCRQGVRHKAFTRRHVQLYACPTQPQALGCRCHHCNPFLIL